jgi:hypothetical protein
MKRSQCSGISLGSNPDIITTHRQQWRPLHILKNNKNKLNVATKKRQGQDRNNTEIKRKVKERENESWSHMLDQKASRRKFKSR